MAETEAKHFFPTWGSSGIWSEEGEKRNSPVIKAVLKGDTLHILKPEDTAANWPTVRADGWVEVDGPARALTNREYWNIMDAIDPTAYGKAHS